MIAEVETWQIRKNMVRFYLPGPNNLKGVTTYNHLLLEILTKNQLLQLVEMFTGHRLALKS